MWYHQKVWSRTTKKFSPGIGSKFTHAPRPCGKWFEVICWRSLKQSYCRENCSQRTDSTTRKRSGASFYACLTNCTHSEAPLLFFLCSWNFDCKDVHIVHWKFGLHEWSLSVWHFVIIRWILFFSHKMFFAEYFVWDLKKNTNVSLKKTVHFWIAFLACTTFWTIYTVMTVYTTMAMFSKFRKINSNSKSMKKEVEISTYLKKWAMSKIVASVTFFVSRALLTLWHTMKSLN